MRRDPPVSRLALAALTSALIAAAPACDRGMFGVHQEAPGLPSTLQPAVVTRIGVDQKPGAQLPLDEELRDASGEITTLRAILRGRPALLVPVYYECPMLCSQVLSGLVTALRAMNLQIGTDYDVVALSFDPSDTPERAATKKRQIVDRYGRPGSEGGFHFLSGAAPAITRITQAIGFRYEYDPLTRQFAHPSTVVAVTPEGLVSNYFFGVEFAPRELRLGIVQASAGKVGSVVDRVVLLCYRYDPKTGAYSAPTLGALRVGGGATLFALGGFVLTMLRRDRRNAAVARKGR